MKSSITTMLCVMLLHQLGHAQSDGAKKHKAFSIGIGFEANYSYRALNYKNQNRIIANERNANEVGRLGISTGISLGHQITEKVTLLYGLDYARFGYNTRYTDLSFVSPGDTYPLRGRTEYLFQSIGIPVSVHYTVGQSKFNPYIAAGLSGNFILRKTSTTKVEYRDGSSDDSSHVPTLGYQRFILSAVLGFGVKLKTRNRFTIAAESLVRGGLTSISPDVNAIEKPYSIGLAIKTFYTFNR